MWFTFCWPRALLYCCVVMDPTVLDLVLSLQPPVVIVEVSISQGAS